ncbi:GNAT family N-acetyltransferase [Ruegeria pomeroyi]|nr:GNAT family N-acetyltransferase [Ruegeria pomeroyi]
MRIRPACISDIDALMTIRGAVSENRLSNPARVRRSDYLDFHRNSTLWICETGGQVVGFSACDPRNGSIWALFVAPGREGGGCGRTLLARACADLRRAGWSKAWLTTGAGTRAERFYRRAGWQVFCEMSDGDLLLWRSLR